MVGKGLSSFVFCTERVKTFQNWPGSLNSSPCNVNSMAECGFIHTPSMDSLDKTTCVFCHCELRDWSDSDIPKLEHYRVSPDCPLLNMSKDEGDWTLEDVITLLYKQSSAKLRVCHQAIETSIQAEIELARESLSSHLPKEN